MVDCRVSQTPHAILVACEHAALDARICADNIVHILFKKKKLQLVTDNILTVEDWLTVVIVRIHVEVKHLPTPDSPVQTSAVAGVSVLAHGQRQNSSAGE